MEGYYREYNANVHRGIYTIGEEATAAYEKARAKVAAVHRRADAHEIVFARNATEAINLVAYAWGRQNIGRGDTIVLTEMEHHANLVPWQLLAQEKDAVLEFIPFTDDGDPRQDVFDVLLQAQAQARRVHPRVERARHDQPGRGMTRRAHEAGALVLVDGAQAVPHLPVDVAAIGGDFYAFCGHKMLGADRLGRAVGAAASCSRRCRRSWAAAR